MTTNATPPPTDLSSLFGLKGRVVYIPGGYGGIGEAVAWALAAAGATVAVSGRSAEKADAITRRLRAAGHEALGLAMDAHSTDSIRSAVDQVARHFGALDILVNCIGIQREERLADVSELAFDEVYRST